MPPSIPPEKLTNSNLGPVFSPGGAGIRLLHNQSVPVENPEVIPNVHRLFHRHPPEENPEITVEKPGFSTFSTVLSTASIHSAAPV
jgi:hypothetical protein